MAVRLERPHPESLGEGEGLPVALLGPVEGRCLARELDRGEEPEDMRLVAALAVLLGEVEGLGGDRERTLGLADAEVRLGEASHPERVIGLELQGLRPFDRLLEERQRLAGAPEVRVRGAQRGRDERPHAGDDLARLARQTGLQDGDGAREVPLGHAHVPEAGAPDDEAEAGVPGLGDPDGLLADRQSLAELPPLGETVRQPGPGEDGGQPGHVAEVVQEVAREQLDVLAQGVHGPGVLAERMVRLAEPEVHRDGQGYAPRGGHEPGPRPARAGPP